MIVRFAAKVFLENIEQDWLQVHLAEVFLEVAREDRNQVSFRIDHQALTAPTTLIKGAVSVNAGTTIDVDAGGAISINSSGGAINVAQYTLIRGFGFARHVRTNVVEEGGIWRGDAVYTISPALPDGITKIDAEVVAADCAENGIPMV